MIRIDNISARYNKGPVLFNISAQIPEGKIIGIIGPNGSGKSTLLKACAGLVPIFQGNIYYFGDKNISDYRKQVAYLPQRESVDWDFPVNALDVVMMGSYGRLGVLKRISKVEKEKALHYLDKVGLKDFAQRHISELSGGQQQRIFLARALMTEADVYLLDEPFAAVDVVSEHMILETLKELRNKGKTILLSHHDLSVIEKHTDYTLLLNKELVAFDTTPNVFSSLALKKAYGSRI